MKKGASGGRLRPVAPQVCLQALDGVRGLQAAAAFTIFPARSTQSAMKFR